MRSASQAGVQRFAKLAAALMHLADAVVDARQVGLDACDCPDRGPPGPSRSPAPWCSSSSASAVRPGWRAWAGPARRRCARRPWRVRAAAHRRRRIRAARLSRYCCARFTSSSRACVEPGRFGDGVVQFEQHRIGQAAHFLEAPFRARPLPIGRVRLPGSGDDPAHQREHEQRRRRQTPRPIALDEFAGAVAQGIGPRGHRLAR